MAALLNTFLRNGSRAVLDSSPNVAFVIGNEGGDMDSVVCAVFAAFLLQNQPKLCPQIPHTVEQFVPLMSFPPEDLALRGDIVQAFQAAGVETDSFVFAKPNAGTPSGTIFPLATRTLDNMPPMILVDHNHLEVSFRGLQPKVCGIIDHHADEGQSLDAQPRIIQPVGSAATLVAEMFQRTGLEPPCPELLQGPILLDTLNLNPLMKKVTPQDVAASDFLLTLKNLSRDELFNSLQTAKSDISRLNVDQLLRLDYKMFSLSLGTTPTRVGMSAFPLLFADAIQKAGTVDQLRTSMTTFLESRALDVLGIMFFVNDNGEFKRELMWVTKKKNDSAFAAVKQFCTSSVDIGFEQTWEGDDGMAVHFVQKDNTISRKKLVPILTKFLAQQ